MTFRGALLCRGLAPRDRVRARADALTRTLRVHDLETLARTRVGVAALTAVGCPT